MFSNNINFSGNPELFRELHNKNQYLNVKVKVIVNGLAKFKLIKLCKIAFYVSWNYF